MEHSQSIKELAEALSTAQGELKSIAKTGKGNFGKYAELAPTLEQVLPVLSKQGLSVTQMPVLLEDGTTGLVTMLMHKSGEWIKSTYPVRMQQQTPQAQGSAITYARRYALMAVVGIAGDDDDGQAGTDGANPEVRRRAASTPPPSPRESLATKTQVSQIQFYLRGQGIETDAMGTILSERYHVVDPKRITQTEAARVIEFLQAKQSADGPVGE